jgi:hypothetical protein
MKANPDKCQALAIGKKSMNTNIVFEFKKMLNSTGPRIDPGSTRLLFDDHLLIKIIGAFYHPMQAKNQ